MEDIYDNLTVLTVEPSRENICAVAAVIQQESGFQVDPVVPNLGSIATQEIDNRAAHMHLPLVMVHGVLAPPDGRPVTFDADIALDSAY